MGKKKQCRCGKRNKHSHAKKGNSMTTEVISDFNGYLLPNQKRVTMEVNGLKAALHMPEALRRIGSGPNEHIWQLPPGAPRAAFSVDEYPACPETWMHGSSKASSYFVPIEAGRGMWIDLTQNEDHPTHHIAAVISIQGLNPVTGQKTDVIRLEQYKENCPVHNKPFQQDLYCAECKHKWPPQNYLSTNSGGKFWLDGFMASDGVVRQWVFTEEEAKGVAAQKIKQERVFAIGIAFYKSKQPKPPRPIQVMRGGGVSGQSLISPMGAFNKFYSLNYVDTPGPAGPPGPTGPTGPVGISGPSSTSLYSADTVDVVGCSVNALDCYADDARGLEAEEKTSGGIAVPPTRGAASRGRSRKSLPEKSIKKLEIGAGARIDQKIYRDPQNVDFWEEEPIGFIYVNYTDEETAKRIIAAGKREEATDGFLTDVQLAK